MSCAIMLFRQCTLVRARARARRRYVESEAWKGFRDSGRMRFAEFGTPLPLVQGVITLLAGVTGLGQGARPGRVAPMLQAAAGSNRFLPRLREQAPLPCPWLSGGYGSAWRVQRQHARALPWTCACMLGPTLTLPACGAAHCKPQSARGEASARGARAQVSPTTRA